jgi:hypothetical protein
VLNISWGLAFYQTVAPTALCRGCAWCYQTVAPTALCRGCAWCYQTAAPTALCQGAHGATKLPRLQRYAEDVSVFKPPHLRCLIYFGIGFLPNCCAYSARRKMFSYFKPPHLRCLYILGIGILPNCRAHSAEGISFY